MAPAYAAHNDATGGGGGGVREGRAVRSEATVEVTAAGLELVPVLLLLLVAEKRKNDPHDGLFLVGIGLSFVAGVNNMLSSRSERMHLATLSKAFFLL